MGANDIKVSSVLERLPEHGHFLEVGLFAPNLPRLQALGDKNIHFWGMDTKAVCDSIWSALPKEFKKGVTLIGNEKQDYNWSLMMLVKALRDRTGSMAHFDAVFLDGHHTLFVDGLAMYLCSQMVKPNGFLIMDDYGWSLNQQEERMRHHPLFGGQYDFSAYTEEQRAVSHLSLVVDYLLPTADRYIPVVEKFAWQKVAIAKS